METSKCKESPFYFLPTTSGILLCQLYATALNTEGEDISYRPLRIGYSRTDTAGRRRRKKSYLDAILENVNNPSRLNKRSAEDELDIEGGVSYIAMEYIKFFTDNMRNIRNTKSAKSSEQEDLLDKLQSLHERLSGGDELALAGRISRVLFAKLLTMISE